MRYIYGPVKSRRLGNSLGITTVKYKTCCFDCIYCQLGKSDSKTVERKEYVSITDIISELTQFLKQREKDKTPLDYITLSGFGEPTLNIKIGQLIDSIKKIISVPVAVLTNSALLKNKDTRNAIIGADLICPSLDAVSQDVFKQINRPAKGMKIRDLIDGLRQLRREFKGKIFLEIMLVRNINDSLSDIKKLKEMIKPIMPDKIFINIAKRYTAEKNIEIPDS